MCKQTVDPAGYWSTENLIGAKCRISSMSISNYAAPVGNIIVPSCKASSLSIAVDCEAYYTISSVGFKVSTDGKAICLVSLEEIPDTYFTLRDLCILELNAREDNIIVDTGNIVTCC